ncbi:organic cation transporter protein-like [Pecten maximus]|uniref:organic cation transporter protein-like n=1 Tax=Pecten maximus TaxID=6579 RepID=UPI001458095C|nr:organic cation transporter protein-like [Pecten maximus]
MVFDDIIKELGEFGPYQRRLLALVLFPQILFALQQMVPVFILSEHSHRCSVPYDNGTSNLSSPVLVQSVSKCDVTLYYNDTNTTQTETCSSWEYDSDRLTSSPISDFDLVCEDKILRTHASMAFLGGNLAGALVLGLVGDTFGRKPVACFSIIFLVFSSIACIWSNGFYMYVIMRFLSGTGSNIACIKIIAIEMVGPSWRALAGISTEIAFCVGEVILCGLAYYIRDWRYLQLAISAPGVILLLYWFVLPESTRWLLARGKTEEANETLRKIAKVNKRQVPKHIDTRPPNEKKHAGFKDIAPLFRSRKHFIRWLINMALWFVLATSYYGLTFNVGKLGGNVYLNFLIFAVVESVGAIITLYLNNRFGRKLLNSVALFTTCLLSILSLVASIYIEDETTRRWILIGSATVGRMSVSGDFANVFIYTSEMFPTSIRSFAVATANVSGMIGATVAPYIADLGQLVDTRFGTALPYVVFGALALIAGVISLVLPETLHKKLPEDVNDIKISVTHNSKHLAAVQLSDTNVPTDLAMVGLGSNSCSP